MGLSQRGLFNHAGNGNIFGSNNPGNALVPSGRKNSVHAPNWGPPTYYNNNPPPYYYNPPTTWSPPYRRYYNPPPTYNYPPPTYYQPPQIQTIPYPQYIPIPYPVQDNYMYDDDYDSGHCCTSMMTHQCHHGSSRSRRRGGMGYPTGYPMGYGGGGGFGGLPMITLVNI